MCTAPKEATYGDEWYLVQASIRTSCSLSVNVTRDGSKTNSLSSNPREPRLPPLSRLHDAPANRDDERVYRADFEPTLFGRRF